MSGHDVKLSKRLSYMLRHGAVKEGLQMRPDGYVSLSDLKSKRGFEGVSVTQLEVLVRNNDKQRFRMMTENGVVYIRANQGHSVTTVNQEELLERINTPEDVGICVHGTYYDAWEFIKCTGLNKMGRNHIHFAAGEVGGSGVISGMRSSAQVKIYVDVEYAMSIGVPFFRSANNVLLSPGLNGVIPPSCFSRVVDVASGSVLFVPEESSSGDGGTVAASSSPVAPDATTNTNNDKRGSGGTRRNRKKNVRSGGESGEQDAAMNGEEKAAPSVAAAATSSQPAAGVVGGNGAGGTTTGDGDSEGGKLTKRLRKRVAEIELLQKRASGGMSLNPDQVAKVQRLPELIAELNELGKRGQHQQD